MKQASSALAFPDRDNPRRDYRFAPFRSGSVLANRTGVTRDAFGPNLRRIRVQRGISLERIAAETKVPIDLWEAMERNDFSRWPRGVYARSFIRDYATAIGVDPDVTIDEFCRWFPLGDRRAEPLVRGQAKIVGHELAWNEELPPGVTEVDRRGGSSKPPSPELSPWAPARLFLRLRRTLGKA